MSANGHFPGLSEPLDPKVPLALLKRSLKVSNRMIKELSQVETLAGVKAMGEVTPFPQFCHHVTLTSIVEIGAKLYILLMETYQRFITTFQHDPQASTFGFSGVADNIEISHLAFKCVSRLILWLWAKIDKRTAEDNATVRDLDLGLF